MSVMPIVITIAEMRALEMWRTAFVVTTKLLRGKTEI